MSLKAGVINLSVLVILTIFLSGFIFRRAFCGWLCPGGGCQLVAQPLNNKNLREQRTDWIRIILISIWVLLMIGVVVFNSSTLRIDIRNPGMGKFASSNVRYFLPYIPTVVFIFLFIYFFGRRGFCHRGCWIYPIIAASTWLGIRLRTPSLFVLVRDKQNCNDCKLCTKNCSMSIDVNSHVNNETSLPNNCIQCGQYIDNCPKDVLGFTFGRERIAHT